MRKGGAVAAYIVVIEASATLAELASLKKEVPCGRKEKNCKSAR